ncbi:MAG: DUF1569 domain-containing protein [Cyclobacteriaceae bacterium]|nr:DUF1569 domain-containing protein [Cyclobacteriaceae bacterium]
MEPYDTSSNAGALPGTIVQQPNSFCSHPFFDKLNRKEWGRLIYKHMNHHLRQFRC